MNALPPELARLSSLEKLELISLLWQSIPEADVPPPTGAELEELQRRIAEDEADPDEGQSWEDVKAELLRDDP
jgi:putative addiction module component (TIGR02574 family)